MRNWPRLTETLRAAPCVCANCAKRADLPTDAPLLLWQEHDDNDKPEAKYLLLCYKCSDEIVENHPRLYNKLDRNAPAPGAMDICVNCRARYKTFCPKAKIHGGPGIEITASKPTGAHIDGRGKDGKRFGVWLKLYALPPSACTGKEPL